MVYSKLQPGSDEKRRQAAHYYGLPDDTAMSEIRALEVEILARQLAARKLGLAGLPTYDEIGRAACAAELSS